MMQYRVVLKRASNGTVVATFPGVPEAHTVGNDEAQALAPKTIMPWVPLWVRVMEDRSRPWP